MDSLPLAARRTNCIRWSSTSTSFQDIVSSLPARNSNPRCKGCLGNDCKGCHGTTHLRWPRVPSHPPPNSPTTCHPEGRAVYAPKDLNVTGVRDSSLETLALPFSDFLPFTIPSEMLSASCNA